MRECVLLQASLFLLTFLAVSMASGVFCCFFQSSCISSFPRYRCGTLQYFYLFILFTYRKLKLHVFFSTFLCEYSFYHEIPQKDMYLYHQKISFLVFTSSSSLLIENGNLHPIFYFLAIYRFLQGRNIISPQKRELFFSFFGHN